MATATIVGGEHVTLNLSGAELKAAQDALAKLSEGYSDGNVLHNLSNSPVPGELNIYEIASPGGTVTLPSGAQGLVLLGNKSTVMRGTSADTVNPDPILLVGNRGNDTVFLTGAGSVISGSGLDSVVATAKGSGSAAVWTGSGNDTIAITGLGSVNAGTGDD
ncbi:MAG: hypothetical protein IPK78_20960 [Rhodospirillales bacterium]|nr:hypothetical protein [Rhodospirillales bacterium]